MYDSPYAMTSNPAMGFLDTSVANMMNPSSQGGLLGSRFDQVMSSISDSIGQSASQGMVPQMGYGNNINNAIPQPINNNQAMGGVTPMPMIGSPINGMQRNSQSSSQQQTIGGLTGAQIAQQMSIGGPMSLLPYLGKSFLPQLIFPVAGLWSLYDGVKAVNNMRHEAALERSASPRFDPERDLQYGKAVEALDPVRANAYPAIY